MAFGAVRGERWIALRRRGERHAFKFSNRGLGLDYRISPGCHRWTAALSLRMAPQRTDGW